MSASIAIADILLSGRIRLPLLRRRKIKESLPQQIQSYVQILNKLGSKNNTVELIAAQHADCTQYNARKKGAQNDT